MLVRLLQCFPFVDSLQAMMVLVMVFSLAVLGLHMYITRRFPAIPAASLPEEASQEGEVASEGQLGNSYRLSLAPGQVFQACLTSVTIDSPSWQRTVPLHL